MSEISFTVVGVASDGVPAIRSDEVQEVLHDLHTDHQDTIKQAKIDAVREFGEWLRGEINWDVRHYCEKHIEQLNKEKGDE